MVFMKQEELENYLNRNLSIREIAVESGKSYTSIRHWMKKYGLKPNFKNFKNGHDYSLRQKMIEDKRFCPKCEEYKELEKFFLRRKNNCSGWCRSCFSKATIEKQRKFKAMIVKYKGGKCQNQNCSTPGGYSRSINAFDFHHIDPSKKEFNISKVRRCKMNEKIKKELDKCILVCANCHREIHEEIILKSQKNYTKK